MLSSLFNSQLLIYLVLAVVLGVLGPVLGLDFSRLFSGVIPA